MMVTTVGSMLLDSVVAQPGETVLESRHLHLGRPGQWEWTEYKDRPVDAEMLELRFQGHKNVVENTLLIWQKNVKLSWPVTLNGRKLGRLTTSESALETVVGVPPGALVEGENVLRVEAPPALDDIEIGPLKLIASPVGDAISGASLEVTVTDEDTGDSLPARITLTRPDGTLQPLQASPQGGVASRVGVVYSKDGRASLQVPPGEYVIRATRGFEWSLASQKVALKRGDEQRAGLKLRREVDTTGWVAADSHIHTLTHSGHGDATIEERMITIAGEGIELAVATDHNHHADYSPVASALGVSDRFASVVGNEVTTKHGHFNAFPILPGSTVVDYGVDDWATLVGAMRGTPGVRVITLNHPRDLHSGFIPLGGVQFNPKTGNHRQAAALHGVDALEVLTSGAMQSDIHLLYRDWFALLNRGHRISAVGSSDSHDVSRFIVGQGRTYVAADDASPAGLNLEQVWESYQKGHLLVSLGLMVNVRVDERFKVGDLATKLGPVIKVEAVVSGPSWITADHVALYANGIMIREESIRDGSGGGKKAVITWEVPRPFHDVHLVAIATGPGVDSPCWETPRPYQPASKDFKPRVIGSTNPIWIDADGDGKFRSAHDYAAELIRTSGDDAAALEELLGDYDAAVRAQAASLGRPGSSASAKE